MRQKIERKKVQYDAVGCDSDRGQFSHFLVFLANDRNGGELK